MRREKSKGGFTELQFGIVKVNETIFLYRYLTAEAAIKTIETRTLRVGRFKEFNDPFELRLGIDKANQLSPQELEEEIRANEGFLNLANEKFGVQCFSSVIQDPILWSHYADSHRGMVIEVECIKDQVFEVVYGKPLPRLPRDRNLDETELTKILVSVLKQKSQSWSYEKEWRGIVKLDECDVGDGMYFKKISGDDIHSVIIGCRSTVNLNYIYRALKVNGWENVQVAKARLSQQEYKVEFEFNRS
jgi:hypothetical protein